MKDGGGTASISDMEKVMKVFLFIVVGSTMFKHLSLNRKTAENGFMSFGHLLTLYTLYEGVGNERNITSVQIPVQ